MRRLWAVSLAVEHGLRLKSPKGSWSICFNKYWLYKNKNDIIGFHNDTLLLDIFVL